MWRKVLLGWMALVCLAGPAAAQVRSVDLDVSAALLTKYIWNGFDRIQRQGLEPGPVVQPKVSLGVGNSPLKAFVAGSFLVNDTGARILGLLDGDRVDLTNLQRQVIHSTDDMGALKVMSAKIFEVMA